MIYSTNYLNELIKSGSIFWFCALLGSGMFFIQFIINIFGLGNSDNLDVNDISSDNGDVGKFKWLSLHTVSFFLLMFGWTAITCQSEFALKNSVTVTIATASGLFAALIIRLIFKLAKKLTSSGSVYRIEDAIGKEAYVYHCIPKGGKGKISMSLQNFTHEIDAISHHYEDLPAFLRVKIIKKSDKNTVVVAPL